MFSYQDHFNEVFSRYNDDNNQQPDNEPLPPSLPEGIRNEIMEWLSREAPGDTTSLSGIVNRGSVIVFYSPSSPSYYFMREPIRFSDWYFTHQIHSTSNFYTYSACRVGIKPTDAACRIPVTLLASTTRSVLRRVNGPSLNNLPLPVQSVRNMLRTLLSECAPDTLPVGYLCELRDPSSTAVIKDEDYTAKLCRHIELILRRSTQRTVMKITNTDCNEVSGNYDSSQVDYVVCDDDDWWDNELVNDIYDSWYLRRERKYRKKVIDEKSGNGKLVVLYCHPGFLLSNLCDLLSQEYGYEPILRPQDLTTFIPYSKLLATRYTLCYDMDTVYEHKFPTVRCAIIVPVCTPMMVRPLEHHDIESGCMKQLLNVVLGVREIRYFARHGVRYNAQLLRQQAKPASYIQYSSHSFDSLFAPVFPRDTVDNQDIRQQNDSTVENYPENCRYFLSYRDAMSKGIPFKSLL